MRLEKAMMGLYDFFKENNISMPEEVEFKFTDPQDQFLCELAMRGGRSHGFNPKYIVFESGYPSPSVGLTRHGLKLKLSSTKKYAMPKDE